VRRRDFLAGVGGAAVLAGGAWYGLSSNGSGSDRLSPVTVKTLDAPGSSAGTLTVPVSGSVTVLDMFSVGCAPCKTETRRLNGLRSKLGSNVRLVSVTNDAVGATLTRDDLRQWWRKNDGDWAVGFDPNGSLISQLGVTGFPFLAVVDADGAVVWSHAGLVSSSKLVDVVDRHS